MTQDDGLWSAQEIRTQAEQCRDQLTVWDALEDACAACGALTGEPCDPFCLGVAAAQDI